ncbi:MAG: Smr/MutS family protein [Deltaproteobacteria bacterium]|nr:Smr/MutS family protein [Deltaproteobacteria bacterium]
MAKSGGTGGHGGGRKGPGGGRSTADREALERAFSDVKPLSRGSKKRVMSTPGSGTAAQSSSRGAPIRPTESLVLEREANGIVLGKRSATHVSILEALEDPRLEVQAECDLHGQTAREAEREVLRFVREAQRSGSRWVLVIVGKGLHSPGGKATLKSTVADALSTRAPARFVLAFRTAPRHLGGTGAFVVRLVDRL